jgi:hypothetical protein
MEIDLRAVFRITVIADDALGPRARAICVALADGKLTMLETRGEIAPFVERLAQEMPEAAQKLRHELAAADRPANYEVVIFQRK